MVEKKSIKAKGHSNTGDRTSGNARPPGLVTPDEPLPLVFRIGLILIFGLLFIFTLREVSSLDVGFHLRTGNYILEGNGWPRTDPFSYTFPHHVYIDSQWGYQVILALMEKIGGSAALIFFHSSLVLACFYLLYRTARLMPIDPVTLLLLFFLSAAAAEFRFMARPDLMSWVFLASVLYILHRYAEGRNPPLWLLPIILLIWVNCHNGFVLGWAAVGCFFVGLSIKQRRFDKRIFKWGSASVLVTVINPYHIHGVLFPFTLISSFRSGSLFGRAISELVSPFASGGQTTAQLPFYPYTILVPYFILFAASLVAAVCLFRKQKYWAVLLFLPFLYLSAKMMRSIPLLVVACLPVMIYGLPLGHVGRLFRWGDRRYRRFTLVAALVLMLLTVGMASYVVTDAYYLSTRRVDRFGWDWNRTALPVEAMNFVNQAGIEGPVLNHLNFGGYLMWATGQKTFIDGRLEVVGEEFYAEYERYFSPRQDKRQWRQALEQGVTRWNIQWIIFPYDISPGFLNLLSLYSAWRLAYVDHKAVIFVRNGPEIERYIDPNLERSLKPSIPSPLRTLPGLFGNQRPNAIKRFMTGFFEKQTFPTHHHMFGLFHYFRREWPKAYAHFTKVVEESRGYYYETYNNLGSASFRLGRLDVARQCYEIVLKEDPKNPIALRRLRQISKKN